MVLRKEKRIKVFMKVLLSLVMLFSLCTQSFISVHAKTVFMDRDTSMSSYLEVLAHKDNLGADHEWGGKRVFKIGNKYAYCIESDVGLSDDLNYKDGNDPQEVLENGRRNVLTNWRQKYEMLSALLTIVPNEIVNDNKTEHIHWLVGQTMIWEITGEERGYFFEYKGTTTVGASAYRSVYKWVYSADKAEFDRYYKEVEDKMAVYRKLPSFTTSRESLAKTYNLDHFDGTYYYTTLTDTNNVLANFNFTASGYEFIKNDNKLTVKTKTPSTDPITINTKPTGALKTRSPVFWTDGKFQKTTTCGDVDDPSPFAYFKVKAGVGNLEIAKKDNKGKFVPNTQFKISYNANMSNPLGTYITGANGKVAINNLFTQTVYIQEIAVPNHLVLDSTIHSVTIVSGDTVTYTAINKWKQGYLQVTKKDKKTNQVVKKSGTEFEILKNGIVIETITTNANGVAKSGLLDFGTYMIREKKAPQNYTITNLTENQAIEENNKVYDIVIYNEPVIGGINLVKEDSETGNVPQGDGTLINAEYVLKANKNILNPSDDSVIFAKDEIISVKNVGNNRWGDAGTKKTNKDAKISWTNLPMGEYRIEETNASEGYLPDSAHIVTLTSTDQNKQVVTQNVTSKEQVIKGKLKVAKSGNDGSSGVVDGLKDVEFTMKLYSEVKNVGWDNAKVYSVFVTDEKGIGTSDDVPCGIYQVKETKTPPNYAMGGDFFVNIDKDQEIEFRMVNNTPFKSWLKIIKQDEKGQSVFLSNATFKLKDSKGNYVKQKVGSTYKDEWTTDDKGYVILDDMLLPDVYTIEEIKNPDGFLIRDSIKVDISSDNKDITLDEDNDAVITVKFVDKKPTGTILLHKQFERAEDVIQDVVKFRLTANADIIDPATGEVIYKKGDVVGLENNEDGIYSIDEKGYLEIRNIPLSINGASYLLEEVETLDGYSLLEEPITVDFKITDNTTEEYIVKKSVENKLTETLFSKMDIAGKELPDAHLKLIDENAKVIDEWISTKEDHLVKGLIYGYKYTLIEDLAPLGYVIANDITFVYEKDIEKVTMIDKIVTAKKVDIDGNNLKGATLQVVSERTKDIIDEWVSDGTSHCINGLIDGESYVIREVKAPFGYALAKDIKFTVEFDKQNQEIIMIDDYKTDTVGVTKYDATSQKELAGAKLQVLNQDGNIIDEWISTEEQHLVLGLIVGHEYTLREVLAPDGYLVAKEVKFIVEDNNEVLQKIALYDKREPIMIKTGDNTRVLLLLVVSSVSGLLLIYFLRKSKKSK